ncbi:MAG: protein kinase [Planctomycetes bacterium]|nr:protein kinase [Planctomycetota bacterium]
MEEQRKTIIATLKAVRQGQLTAEQAVAILKLAGIEPGEMLTQLHAHLPPQVSSTQNTFNDDADEDERLTALLSDGERVSRAVSVFEPAEATDSTPMSLEFPEEAPQSGISLDTRTLLSLEGGGSGGQGSGAPIRSRLMQDAARYEIKREFARGGMGRILLSRDLDVGRDVALKELLPELVSGGTRLGTRAMGSAGGGETDETGERFLREAKVTGQLEHPNIVPVYEIGERDDGNVYYTMKYVRGKTMAARLREIRKDDSLSEEQKNAERLKLLDAFVAMCNAIAFAHSRGVIHRDIKPENVMLGDFGETMLLDWGLARVKNQRDFAVKNKPKERNISDSLRESADASKTQDGYIIGTPAYMPPEQGRGDQEEVDEKSDIYSLGSVLYEILAGTPPYEGPTAGLVLQAMLTSAPAPISGKNRYAPPELLAVCEKAMAREKKDRFKSAMEISLQVQAFREGRNLSVYQYSAKELVSRYIKRHKATVAVIAIGVLMVLAGGIYAAGTLLNQTALAQAARRGAEEARDTATLALDAAQREQQRERDLMLAAQQRRERELRERAHTIKALRKTSEGIRLGPLSDDARERVARYESAQTGLALASTELRENQVLLASLVGYISAKENLLALLSGVDTNSLPEAAGIDVATDARELERTRILTAKLAALSGDFALSAYILGGVTSDVHQREKQAVLETCRRLLDVHRATIEKALEDVAAGLQRPGRAKDAPELTDYVEQLAALRDQQTVALLARALAPIQARAEAGHNDWTPQEYDLTRLVLRVLGRIDLPADSVPVLAKFLPVIKEPELLVECGLAMCETRSPEAFEPLAEIGRYRFNYIWESMEAKFALVPLPLAALKPATATEFHKRALARRARGDFDGAIADCTSGLALDPRQDLLLIARAFSKRAKGDVDGALLDFSAAIDMNSSQLARALVARGNCLRLMGDIDRALADFSRSIDLDPRNPTPYIARGLCRRDGGDLNGALSDFSSALELDPRRAQTWTHRGEAKAYLGDVNGAIDDYSRAIACNPEFAEAFTLRGMIERNRNRFTESIRDLTHAARLNPTDPRNYSWRAQSEFGNDDLVGAINSCTRAIELDPRAWQAWYYRGITHLQLDQRRKPASISQTTNPPAALDDEAKTAALRAAVADITRAHECNSVDFLVPLILGEVYTRLGDRYQEIGDIQAAREAWQKCIDVLGKLKQVNPYGAHYYNDRLALSEAERGIEGARARLDAEETPVSTRDFIKRAGARALLAGDAVQDKKLLLLRLSLADLEKARSMVSTAERDALMAMLFGLKQRLMRALSAAEFFHEALSLFEEIDGPKASPSDLYDAACANARLAGQYESARVMRLGEDGARRSELEYAINSQAAAVRKQEREVKLSASFTLLKRAFEAGFGDLEQALRDVDLQALREDARWADFAAGLREIVKGRNEAGLPQAQGVVVANAVRTGSLASKAGISAQDVIWTVNGTRVTDLNSIKNALLMGKAGDILTLVLRRYQFDASGNFVLKADANGKPVLDAQGNTQWDFEERQVLLKRGTVKSLGFLAEGGITGIGIGIVPAPPKP